MAEGGGEPWYLRCNNNIPVERLLILLIRTYQQIALIKEQTKIIAIDDGVLYPELRQDWNNKIDKSRECLRRGAPLKFICRMEEVSLKY